ncbi:MAG: hypothetical protein ACK56G_18600, partial [Pirellulaceae bacterium]
ILLSKLSPFLVRLPLSKPLDVIKPLDQADHPVRARRIDLPGLYAHAQVHPGGMTAEGIGMGRWESWTTS